MENSWSFWKVWNDSIEMGRPDKEVKPRDYLWASELGGSVIDIFLKLKGITPTNPPNFRANRKFEAGNMMEWVVEMVLRRAGICVDAQKWVSHEYPGLLRVTGRVDFLAGGKPDWQIAEKALEDLQLPEFFGRATKSIITHLKNEYPSGLPVIGLEVKSCSSFMFEKYLKGEVNTGHQLQLFHYLKSGGFNEGHIVYICKDDLRMLEIGIANPSPVEDVYRAKIEEISNYYKNDQQPPLEPELIFDNGRVSSNWKIEYSAFLTHLYGYKEPENYRERWKYDIPAFNRVLSRISKGQPVTENNKVKIVKMAALIPALKGIDKLEQKDLFQIAKSWKTVKEEDGE